MVLFGSWRSIHILSAARVRSPAPRSLLASCFASHLSAAPPLPIVQHSGGGMASSLTHTHGQSEQTGQHTATQPQQRADLTLARLRSKPPRFKTLLPLVQPQHRNPFTNHLEEKKKKKNTFVRVRVDAPRRTIRGLHLHPVRGGRYQRDTPMPQSIPFMTKAPKKKERKKKKVGVIRSGKSQRANSVGTGRRADR